MPAKTPRQRRAAAAELARRRSGAKPSKSRPFGTASVAELRKFASKTHHNKKHKR